MKHIIVIIIVIAIIVIVASSLQQKNTTFGVTFSPLYIKYLGMDFKKTFILTLDDLKIRHFRIPTYWSSVEKEEGKLNFDEVDFMVDEALKRNAKIVLVVGIKQPRWPECHIPDWARKLPTQKRQEKALEYIEKVAQRYKDKSNIVSWQVENEPFVDWFGENCDIPDANFLQQEVDLVKKLDQKKRPIIITDTGEWSWWRKAAKPADILGISLYRKAYNEKFGYITYPFPAWLYTFKSKLIGKETIISELQAEPWAQQGLKETPLSDQFSLFSPKELETSVKYAKRTGFSEVYLWGVEWWYFMAERGYPQYIEYAKKLF